MPTGATGRKRASATAVLCYPGVMTTRRILVDGPVAAAIAGAITGALVGACRPAPPPTTEPPGQVCTREAKLCPDGSAVGRTGPHCEFAACPGDPAMPPPPNGVAPDPAPPVGPTPEPEPVPM